MSNLVPVDNYGQMKTMARDFVATRLLPEHIKTPEQACLIMLKGAELGIPPIHALEQIYVVRGKTTMKAELMKAQVHAKMPTATFRIVSTDAKACVIEAGRPNEEPTKFTYTWDDAVKAGDSGKDQYKKRPATMLKWRCITEVCRTVFPDCLMGISYSPDELGAKVDDDGNPHLTDGGEIIDAETSEVVSPIEPPASKPQEPSQPPQEMKDPEPDELYEGLDHQRKALFELLKANGVDQVKQQVQIATELKGQPWKKVHNIVADAIGVPF